MQGDLGSAGRRLRLSGENEDNWIRLRIVLSTKLASVYSSNSHYKIERIPFPGNESIFNSQAATRPPTTIGKS